MKQLTSGCEQSKAKQSRAGSGWDGKQGNVAREVCHLMSADFQAQFARMQPLLNKELEDLRYGNFGPEIDASGEDERYSFVSPDLLLLSSSSLSCLLYAFRPSSTAFPPLLHILPPPFVINAD